jgi:hypothetical protein
MAQNPQRFRVINRQPIALLQRPRRHPTIGAKRDPVKDKRLIMIGKSQHQTISPRHSPDPTHRR